MIFEIYLSDLITLGIIIFVIGILYSFIIILGNRDKGKFDFLLPFRNNIKKFDKFCDMGIPVKKPESDKSPILKVVDYTNKFIKFILGFTPISLIEIKPKKK